MSLIWVTGADGQVGTAVSNVLNNHFNQRSIRFFSRSDFDITNNTLISSWFQQEKPQCIMNLAAYTAVEQAELEQDRAFAVNAIGVQTLAKLCALHAIPLIHVSTDYVFAGDASEPYSETAPVVAASVYGQSKALGEQLLSDQHLLHIILRTSWVYSATQQSFVSKILQKAWQTRSVSVVSDQIGCPTAASHLALVLCQITERILEGRAVYGTYHYRDDTIHSWYSFAKDVLFYAAKECSEWRDVEVLPVLTSAFPTFAKRPTYSVLGMEKLIEHFGIHPMSCRDGTQETVRQILEHRNYNVL